MYSTGIAYLLWLLSGFGVLGFHRLYLGKIPTAILWMCTGGLFGFGAFFDFFTLSGQVREANMRTAIFGRTRWNHIRSHNSDNGNTWRNVNEAGSAGNKESAKERPERIILKIAKENNGIITVSDVALGADIPIEEAKKYLDALVTKGFAELRVRKSGSLVYVIPDMFNKDEELEDI